ncbi:hypothetical protein F5887DRAFT_1084265 [Amanita rubescens]|nr:hypothetical protein F5887DRAFT_1084265 [Amanita rubescens]
MPSADNDVQIGGPSAQIYPEPSPLWTFKRTMCSEISPSSADNDVQVGGNSAHTYGLTHAPTVINVEYFAEKL